VAEGSSARHIRDEGWNLNKAIKMAAKSAMIEATIRVSGLTGVFIKTHRHTLKNNLPAMTKYPDNLTPQGNCNSNGPHYIQQEKPITQRQKDLIQRIAGRKGMTTESLERFIQEQFNKHLDNLTRVEASKCIQHLNG
jgi:DNA-binding phage protein